MRVQHLFIGLATGLMLWAGAAAAQQKPGCEAKPPETVQGQVTKIDAAGGIVTIQEANGTVHQFQASKEMLQNTKVGDHLKGKLREAPKCP